MKLSKRQREIIQCLIEERTAAVDSHSGSCDVPAPSPAPAPAPGRQECSRFAMTPIANKPFTFRVEGNAAVFPAYWVSAKDGYRLVWHATFVDTQRVLRNETLHTIIVEGCRLQARIIDIQVMQERYGHNTGRLEILSGVDKEGNVDPTWNPFDI